MMDKVNNFQSSVTETHAELQVSKDGALLKGWIDHFRTRYTREQFQRQNFYRWKI
jgi:hypothetical protein